jgi:predicted DNA-binding antitoxin AbrB/MazE fold protein
MIQKVDAIYTDGVLKPTSELSLRDNQRVRLRVETIDDPSRDRQSCDRPPESRHRQHAFFLGGTTSQARKTA